MNRLPFLPFVWVAFMFVPLFCGEAMSPYSNEEGKFTINMPGEPELQEKKLKTDFGIVVSKIFISQHPDLLYMIMYTDMPPEAMRQIPEDQMFEGGKMNMLESVNGKLLIEEVIEYQSYAGREFLIKLPDETVMRARTYVIGERLYVTMTQTANTPRLQERAIAYLDSFRYHE